MSDWLCGFALIASWFCSSSETLLTGYIEGENVFLAPLANARIEALLVERGAQVQAGDVIARMESDDARFAFEAAQAQLAEAQARLENLTTGKRAEEIAVLEAARVAAKADLAQAEIDLRRATDLVARRMQSQSALDSARTQSTVAAARLKEIEANLRVATIAARAPEIDAARHAADARRAEVQRAQWQLEQRNVIAPEAGIVEEVIRYQGEVAGPNAPIANLIVARLRKLRLFVPQNIISRVHLGDQIKLSCDGCDQQWSATINFVADEPEFTPPVLYSVENRQKLVVLVEARLDDVSAPLKVGQIVDVQWVNPI